MRLFELLKYAPILVDLLDDFRVLIDESEDRENRVDAVLNVLDRLADLTDTDLDDKLVGAAQDILDKPETWEVIDAIMDAFTADDEYSLNQAEERAMDPATILLLINIISQLIKAFRK
jgi:hypothetical protein